MTALLSITGVSKQFNGKGILSDLSLDIHSGEAVAVVGRNGSGKSTLLKLIGGLLKPDKGRIVFTGKRMAYLPDTLPKLRFTLQEYLSAMGRIQGLSKQELNVILPDIIEEFGLREHAHQNLNTYSKGMLQKAVVMQALLRQPDLLLMDEPYSGLDIVFQKDFSFIMSQLKKRGVTIIFSSHEQSLIDDIADEVILIQHGAGRAVRCKTATPLTEIVMQWEKEAMLQRIVQLPGVQLINRDGSLVRLSCKQPDTNVVLKEIIAFEAGAIVSLQPLTMDYSTELAKRKG